MKNYFIVSIFFSVLLNGAVHSKSLVPIYVQNTTDHALILPEGGVVLPGQLEIFRQVPASFEWNDVFVTGLIQPRDKRGLKSCQVSFRSFKDLDYHRHAMKAVIFVRHKKGRLVCTPQAAEFNPRGDLRPGGLRLSLEKAYHKLLRPGKIRPGTPHLVYEFAPPDIPFVYVQPKGKHFYKKKHPHPNRMSRQAAKLLR